MQGYRLYIWQESRQCLWLAGQGVFLYHPGNKQDIQIKNSITCFLYPKEYIMPLIFQQQHIVKFTEAIRKLLATAYFHYDKTVLHQTGFIFHHIR